MRPWYAAWLIVVLFWVAMALTWPAASDDPQPPPGLNGPVGSTVRR